MEQRYTWDRNVGSNVFSFSQACRFLSPSSSDDGSWAGSSSGSPAAESEAKRWEMVQSFSISIKISGLIANVSGLDLGLLILDPPDTAGAVHHRVLWHDLARVDLAARANDAAAGEDHVPAKIGWEPKDAKQLIDMQKGSDSTVDFSL